MCGVSPSTTKLIMTLALQRGPYFITVGNNITISTHGVSADEGLSPLPALRSRGPQHPGGLKLKF